MIDYDSVFSVDHKDILIAKGLLQEFSKNPDWYLIIAREACKTLLNAIKRSGSSNPSSDEVVEVIFKALRRRPEWVNLLKAKVGIFSTFDQYDEHAYAMARYLIHRYKERIFES